MESAPTMGIPFVRAKRCEVDACGSSCPPCKIYGKAVRNSLSFLPILCKFYQNSFLQNAPHTRR